MQRGNIHIADVRLDGVPLFPVAAAADGDPQNRQNISPIEWRVNEIETRLQQIVNKGFEPNALRVTVQTMNQQTVIVASGNGWEQPLMTVTELDRQIDNTASTFIELADVLRDRLLHAHKERQPDHLKSRSKLAAIVITLTLLVSGLVRHLQQRLKQQWRGLNQRSSPHPPQDYCPSRHQF